MKAVALTKGDKVKNFKHVTAAAKYLKVPVHKLEYTLSNTPHKIKGYEVELLDKKKVDIDYTFEKWAAEAFDVKVEDLVKPNRLHNDVTYARYVCYLYLAKYTAFRFRDIGNRYGNRSYSAVSYGIKRALELLEVRDNQFILGVDYFNDILEEYNIIKNGEFKTLDKSWTFTDKEISSMKFMVGEGIKTYKIATHFGITIYDLRHILNKNNKK
jgi:hypothetical protein